MDFTAALRAELALLTDALGDPAAETMGAVADSVLLLAAGARLAVPSFIGLTVTAHRQGAEELDRVVLRFTLFDRPADPEDIQTSLRLPRSVRDAAAAQPHVEAVLYAATPGAFVDLAADLAFLTRHEFDTADIDQHRGLAHEADITGVLQSETTINEAIGVLIARGRTPEQANGELNTLADAANTDRATEANRILTTLSQASLGGDLAALEWPEC